MWTDFYRAVFSAVYFQINITAVGTRFIHRLIPGDEITLRIFGAAVKMFTFLGALFRNHSTAVLPGTVDTDIERFDMLAFRIVLTSEETAEFTVFY